MNFKNSRILEIQQFGKIKKFQNLKIWKIKEKINFTIWKINILQFKKLLNIVVKIISQNDKISSKIKLVILIFTILKFQNIGRSIFRRSKH